VLAESQSFDDFLARLLLLQNVAALLPEKGLNDFICEGLSGYPGVTKVVWEMNGNKEDPKSIYLPLKYAESNFGTIRLFIHDNSKINPYLPYLKNFAVMLAVILETKRKEVKARAEQETFFELSPDLMCVANLRGYYTKLSRSWERSMGWTRAELCAEPLMNFIHPDDFLATKTALKDLTQGESVYGFTNRFRHKNGHYRWLEWVAFPEEGENIYGVARDITEVREAQRALKLAASVYNNTNDSIFVCNGEGIILSVNRAFENHNRYLEHEIVGKSLEVLSCDRNQDGNHFADMSRVLREQGSWHGETLVCNKVGKCYMSQTTITPVKEGKIADGERRFIGVLRDITAQKSHEEKIRELAYSDSLTNLANRTLLLDRLDHAILKASRANKKLAVIFIDLDNFKSINDSLGHDIGDKALKLQAKRLSSHVRKSDTVARMGGDEFVVLTESVNHIHEIGNLVKKIIKTLANPIEIDEHILRITCSVGISLYPDDGADRISLMRSADAAMYAAKSMGRNGFRFFSAGMTDKANERLKLEVDLHQAWLRKEFIVHYQPRVDLRTRAIIGAEALVRWQHPSRGLLFPDAFIRFAEESGQIEDLGLCVIELVIQQIALWRKSFQLNLPIAINLSALQFNKGDFAEVILDTCNRYEVPTSCLEVEVTESMVMEDPEKAALILRDLRSIGIRIAIDDFGTGHSSLAYLKKLPLDILKIDRTFVMDIHKDEDDLAIAQTIVALSNVLDLEVIAEGVELESHVNILLDFGVPYAQGYFFAKPMPHDEFIRFCMKERQQLRA